MKERKEYLKGRVAIILFIILFLYILNSTNQTNVLSARGGIIRDEIREVEFIGEIEDDYAGSSVSGVGDVNNDGYDDLIVSAGNNDEGGSDAGQVYLILGRINEDWNPTILLSEVDASFIAGPGNDWAGYYPESISGVGDVNNDGYNDFIIGSCNYYENTFHVGRVHLILGRATDDWQMDTSLTEADASFIGEGYANRAGESVSGVGDVNNDGFDDFIIGAGGNTEGGDRAGQTYLILGRPTNDWQINVPLSDASASFIGEHEDDYSGRCASGVRDVNHDGYDDFIIGAFGNAEGGDNAGQTYLILGRPTEDWQMDTSLAEADASFLGEIMGDLSGECVSGVGDVNSDGFDDFAIGAKANDEAGSLTGQTYLILGRPTEDWQMDTSLSEADASFIGVNEGDRSGDSVSGVGDVNMDGFDDFLISAGKLWGSDADAGKIHLFLGRRTSSWGMDISLSDADAVFIGEAEGDCLGTAISGVGDVNNDGYDDFLVGAIGNDEGGTDSGKSYLVLQPFAVRTITVSSPFPLPPVFLAFSLIICLMATRRET